MSKNLTEIDDGLAMDRQELVEKYLQNQLSEEERVLFDRLLEEDEEFRSEVQFMEDIQAVSQQEDERIFREQLLIFEKESNVRRMSGRYVKLLLAASIALVVSLGYVFWPKPQESMEQIFVEHFEPYRNVIQPVVRGEEQQKSEKQLAFQYYEQGKYDKAIVLFDKLYSTSKEPYYLFYKANALIQLNRAKEAIPLLEAHLKTKDTLAEKSPWYLAMAYLKINDKNNTKKWLQQVVEQNRYKAQTAQKLLRSLN
nr:CDC27 family protein [uncultured Allomuricauda sp.]